MSSLDDFVQTKLAALESRHLRRTLITSARHDSAMVEREGRQLISFSCNDYLGLSSHPALIEAARKATEKFGVGAGASRLDRKSTRLNSSHLGISYAVFC